MKSILDLPIDKIIKDEDSYDRILRKRLGRLKKWKPEDQGEISEKFNAAVMMTKKAGSCANELLYEIETFKKTANESNEEALERVFLKNEEYISSNIQSPKSDTEYECSIKRPREIREQTKDILLKAMSNTESVDETLNNYIDREIAGKPDPEKVMIKMSASTIYSAFSSYQETKNIIAILVQFSEIMRGTLYSGIIDIEGGRLDRKIFHDHLKDLGTEALGLLIPGLGIYKKIVEMISEFHLEEDRPKSIDDAIFIKNHITKYEILLRMWENYASNYCKNLNEIMENYLSYWPEIQHRANK